MDSDYRTSPHWNPRGGSVRQIGGRVIQVGKVMRVRRNIRRPEWGWIDKAPICWLDTGDVEVLTLAQINKRSKAVCSKCGNPMCMAYLDEQGRCGRIAEFPITATPAELLAAAAIAGARP